MKGERVTSAPTPNNEVGFVIDLPRWCQVPSPFVGRDTVVRQAVEALPNGPITLVGPPGAGATTVGGAVLRAAVEAGIARDAVAIRADGCSNVSDLIRELGIALALPMPGDPSAVRSRLRQQGSVAILIDDADLSPQAVNQVRAITGECPLVTTGREAVVGDAIYIDPLSDPAISPLLGPGQMPSEVRGLPLLTRLPPPVDPVDPWSTMQNLPPGSELLADVPMGLDDEGVESPTELRPFLLPVHGRMVFRRAVRETLGASQRPSAETLREVVHDRLPELHRIAADVDPFLSHEDIVLLRTAAEQIQEPDLRAVAGAAAARMMIRLFQAPDALALTQVLLAIPLPATARALLRWVQGDAQYTLGSDVEAQAAWRDAERSLIAANRADMASALTRAVASRLLVRGNTGLLEPWVPALHSMRTGSGDRTARADAERIHGNIASVAGERASAMAHLATARTNLLAAQSRFGPRAIVSLTEAIEIIDDGEVDKASKLVEEASTEVRGHPLLRALCSTLQGEIALRNGQPDQAWQHAERAVERWRWTGSVRGLCVAYRILGDARALSGHREEAIVQWQESVRLGVRVLDVGVVKAALERVAAVEMHEGADGPHAEEAQKQFELAQGIDPRHVRETPANA